MRIALIADTHGFLDPRIAKTIRGADILIHAGDVGGSVANDSTPLAGRVVFVQGNNDAPHQFDESARIALPGGDLVVIHGHQWPARTRHARLRSTFPEAGAIVCGHSHRRVIDDSASPWILNPGAAGRARAYGGPGYIQLTIDGGDWRPEICNLQPLRRAKSRSIQSTIPTGDDP